MTAPERLIGPVPLNDAHLLTPMADATLAADRLAQLRTDPTASLWFLERVPVARVDQDAIVRTPDQDQFDRIKALRPAVTRGLVPPPVLVHDTALEADRGEYAVIDGRLRYNATLAVQARTVLAWVAHLHHCCPLGRPRRPRQH